MERRVRTSHVKPRRDIPSAEEDPASQQYTGHYAGLHGEDAPYLTAADVREHMKRPAYEPDELEASQWITRLGRRYTGTSAPDGVIYRDGNNQVYVHKGPPPVPQRASRGKNTTAQYQIPQQAASLQQRRRGRRRLHWLFFAGIAFLVILAGYVALNAFGAWWQIHSDDGTYGRPRTFQMDAVVGHHDSSAHPSHFIALNLNSHIVVIEIPGGDVSHSVIYSGGVLVGDGQDLTPITLSFQDEPGSTGPAMIIHISDQTIIFLNNGTKFVPPSNVVSGGSLPLTPGGDHAAGEDPYHSRLL